jgi:hypothetical protein
MSNEGMEKLRARVHGDVELARRLRRIEPEKFEAEILRLAAEAGSDVTLDDLHAAAARGRHAWILRWIR